MGKEILKIAGLGSLTSEEYGTIYKELYGPEAIRKYYTHMPQRTYQNLIKRYDQCIKEAENYKKECKLHGKDMELADAFKASRSAMLTGPTYTSPKQIVTVEGWDRVIKQLKESKKILESRLKQSESVTVYGDNSAIYESLFDFNLL